MGNSTGLEINAERCHGELSGLTPGPLNMFTVNTDGAREERSSSSLSLPSPANRLMTFVCGLSSIIHRGTQANG